MCSEMTIGYANTPLSELDRKKYKLEPIDKFLTHEYVPDFAMVLKAANTFYSNISSKRSFHQEKMVCPWGNLLYNIYAHMSVLVNLHVRKGSRDSLMNRGLLKVQKMFECAGFDDSPLLFYSSEWLNGLGEHHNPELGVTIRPNLGDPDENLIREKGFWNKSSAELLPNVKMIIKGALISEEIVSSPSGFSAISSKLEDEYDLKDVDLKLIAGFSGLSITPLTQKLKTLLLETTSDQEEPLIRYLCMNQNLLVYLHRVYSPLYSKTKCSLECDLSSRGSELGMLSCVEISTPKISYDQKLEPVDTDENSEESNNSETAESGMLYTVRQVAKLNLPSHRARVCSRTESKLVQYARHFPLVRIVSPHNRIFEDSGHPHSDWFYSGFNFQTDEFDLDDYTDNFKTTEVYLSKNEFRKWKLES